jgi:methyl-accepting chemotaxis protein
MVEETTAAIHNLASEASEMDGRLGQFVLAPDREQTAYQEARQFRRAG